MKKIEWKDINLGGKNSGNIKTKCPDCNPTRSNKADRSLSVNIDKGVALCHYCEAISIRDKVEFETQKKYVLPPQTWTNYTELSDRLVKYFEGRGIKQYVLKDMNITEEKYYQPRPQKEVNNIVFNYFEGDVLVNKKYRDAGKNFTQSKDGKPILYNINSAIFSNELYIVEGEIDVLSLIQIGIKNVVSVPNGANDNDQYWINSEPYLKDVKKFYIGVDNDEKGNAIAEKMAQRLGRYRCERINWVGKDANEDLIAGELEKSVKNTTSYPVSGTFTAKDLSEKMIDLYDKGLPPTIQVKNPTFERMNNIFKAMFGQLIVCTGIPSHGKSNFTEWYVINLLVENDYKASFFSPEHQPMELHQSTFVQKVIGKNYFFDMDGTPRVSKQEIQQYIDWADQKLYLTSPDDGGFATWDWIFEKFTEQIYSYGINIFVIDAFNKVEFTGKKTERENINWALSRLTSFAQAHNVLIVLVAHPTKMNRDGVMKMPDLYDVSGSADFRNQTHCGYAIHRVFDENDNWTVFKNLKVKYAFQGDIGSEIEFRWHKPSGRMYDKFMSPQTHNLLTEAPLPQLRMEPARSFIEPNHEFNNDNQDIPF
jgi:twinkle protein